MKNNCIEYVWRAETYNDELYITTMDSAILYKYIKNLKGTYFVDLTDEELEGLNSKIDELLSTIDGIGSGIEQIDQIKSILENFKVMLDEFKTSMNDGEAFFDFVIKYEEETQMELIKNVLESLQYTGIGGKRSIGYGSFNIDSITSLDKSQYYDEKVLYDLMENSDDSKYFMLISLLSPEEDEIEEFDLEKIYYSLIKRGGFIYSSGYSENNQKKNDIYMLEEGSTFNKKYLGGIKNLAENGKHPVYRYGIGMYIGIKY